MVRTMSQSHIVEAHDLRRTYKVPRRPDYEAVRGVDLAIRRGELFALLGTNGSGKTSIMEILEGHVPPSGGTCTVLGKDPYADRDTVRPRTGIVLQEGNLQNDLTVTETLHMWSGTLTNPRPYSDVVELVDLTNRTEVPVNRLSGGERRRLDFALAILGRPEVLFLDEPTAGLDPEGRARTHSLMRDLLDHGTTVVLTTHYLQEAEDLADRLAILHEGVIVAAGTPAEIVSSTPAHITFSVPLGSPNPGTVLTGKPTTETKTTFGSRQKTRIETFAMQETLDAVLKWAAVNQLKLDDLEARPASLEQTFLAMAGTRSEKSNHDKESA